MYYIEKNNKILLYDKDEVLFMNSYNANPDYEGLEIKETEQGYTIVDFQLMTVEEAEQKKYQQEAEKIAQLKLTKREVFLALYKDKGITPDMLKAQIKDVEALIEFEYAESYFRGNPLINQIGTMLGYTVEQLDYLFQHGEFEKNIELIDEDEIPF